jgi:hypothetical protein
VVGGVLGGSFVDGADGVESLPPAGGAGSAANAGPAALSAMIAAAPPAAPRRAMFILPPAVSAWPHRIWPERRHDVFNEHASRRNGENSDQGGDMASYGHISNCVATDRTHCAS